MREMGGRGQSINYYSYRGILSEEVQGDPSQVAIAKPLV